MKKDKKATLRAGGAEIMKRILALAGCLLFLAAGKAEPVSFGTVTVDSACLRLDLGGEGIEDWDAFYAFLGRLPAVRRVDLYATKVSGSEAERLTARFPEIDFGMTLCFADHGIRTDATAFSTLHTSHSARHRDEDFSVLRFCPSLRALDLGHNRLTRLDFLEELPELRVLILSMNDLEDITPVGTLKHLEYLELFNNRIRDLSCLAGLEYLTDLNLSGNRIGTLKPLADLSGLKRLGIRNSMIGQPPDQFRKETAWLRQCLPECEIDAVSPSLQGTWRNHPHAEIIRRIFQTGRYEPFEDSPAGNRPDPEPDHDLMPLLRSVLREDFSTYLAHTGSYAPSLQPYVVDFLAAGITSIAETYVRTGKRADPETLESIIYLLMRGQYCDD